MRFAGSWKRLLTILLLAGLAALAALPARDAGAQQIHKNGFEGRQTGWLRGADNVRAEEKEHRLSADYAHLGTASEFIRLTCPEGKNDPNFATYYYPTQPAPVTDDLVASVHVKATRAGVRLQARLVLPRERNPNQIDEPLTLLLDGDAYRLTRRWQKLAIGNPVKLLKDQQQLLRTQLRRDIDLTDAYIDRLVLNLYTGPGEIDVYIDDLEIGPVRPVAPPPAKAKGPDGTPVNQPKILPPPARVERVPVRMEQDKIFVDNKPFFFRAVRYTDTPLKALRDAGFNTVWFDPSVPGERIEEAVGHGFWIVPNLPLLGDRPAKGSLTGRGADVAAARDVEGLAASISRFLSGDSVLFWDLGGAVQTERADRLEQTARAVALADPQRPRGADVWDGFRTVSHFVEIVGTHRYPLLTSLELTKYRDWLGQRRRLTASGTALHWTWVQTHVPEWQVRLIYGRDSGEGFDEPIGPQPEQIRLLTYIGLAAGCRGLAFSSDRFLADSHQGRDRLLMMALLNQEIHMLEPLLLTLRDVPVWIDTSNPHVKAAVLRCERGLLVLPVWLGDGAQYVPPQGAVPELAMIVPLVPDGMQPWEVGPARVRSLQNHAERKLGGTKVVIPEFDLTAAVVFTNDLTPKGDVANWQRHSRLMAPQAAEWALGLAEVELAKVRATHQKLEGLAPAVPDAADLLRQAERRVVESRRLAEARDFGNAYQEAVRAQRPLRILMRAHWEHAVRTLDAPSASPFAVSFYTLPRHWELHRELSGTRLGPNALPGGDFEAAARRPDFVPVARKADGKLDAKASAKAGAPLTDLPGWTAQQQTLDAVEMELRLVPSELAKVEKPKPLKKKWDPYAPGDGRSTDPQEPPEPELGEAVLRLDIKPKVVITDKDGKPKPAPAALERTYLAVNSPAVRLQPGTWVRVSGWYRVATPIQSSADGLLIFDSAGGEGMGLRLTDPTSWDGAGPYYGGAGPHTRLPPRAVWKPFHLYRRVPESGVIYVTAALTGIGTAFIDDLRIEPLLRTSAKPEERDEVTPPGP
jgi:hypothetical protein